MTSETLPEHARQDHRWMADRLVASLFLAGGMALGAIAGGWDHQFSAIVLVLPVVVLSSRFSRRRNASLVAVAGVAVWAIVRQTTIDEPVWSFVLTLAMSLLILCAAGWLMESLRRAWQQVAYFAKIEPLTGLLNRNAFFARLESEIQLSRLRHRPLAVAFLDCDHFKAWNDSHGHRAGDELLQAVAVTLRNGTRRSDVAARLGGDEFALLLPEISYEDAERVVHRLQDALRHEMSDRNCPLTVSIGLTIFEAPPKSTREVMDIVDRLMYEAKQSGKDQVVSLRQTGEPLESPRSGGGNKLQSTR